jgi:hypothetical protein
VNKRQPSNVVENHAPVAVLHAHDLTLLSDSINLSTAAVPTGFRQACEP